MEKKKFFLYIKLIAWIVCTMLAMIASYAMLYFWPGWPYYNETDNNVFWGMLIGIQMINGTLGWVISSFIIARNLGG